MPYIYRYTVYHQVSPRAQQASQRLALDRPTTRGGVRLARVGHEHRGAGQTRSVVMYILCYVMYIQACYIGVLYIRSDIYAYILGYYEYTLVCIFFI